MADESTICSLVPFEIREEKTTLYPGNFTIPAAKTDDFELLVVGRSIYHIYAGADRGAIPVPSPSDEVAKAVVDDYLNGQLGHIPGEAEPGLFWVPGGYTDKKAFLSQHKAKVDEARRKQKNWFERLVAMADDEWNKYRNHKMISDLQRYAASYLHLKRDWDIKGTVESMVSCIACKAILPVGALVCSSCRTIQNQDEYKKRGFQTVG